MRMLGEMAVAHPSTGSFADYAGIALGDWARFAVGWLYWYFWVIVLAVEAAAGAAIIEEWLPGVPIWASSLVLMLAADGHEPRLRALLRRVRVLVRVDQGGGDRRVHRRSPPATSSPAAASTS